MKVLGLIGGMSYVSTMDYYNLINKGVNDQLGGMEFAECIMRSFNFGDIIKYIENNRWEELLNLITHASLRLKADGAEAILICANTVHVIANQLEQRVQLPVIHIARETAEVINIAKLNKVGLLGTKPTMELDFFKNTLKKAGIEIVLPDLNDRDFINQSIFKEFGKGIFSEPTKNKYLKIIDKLNNKGAQGIILGCTELPILIKENDVALPLFKTTNIHAAAAVRFALGY